MIVSRLFELLVENKFGLIVSRVENLYEERFHKKLKDGWTKLIEHEQSGFEIDEHCPSLPVIKLKDKSLLDSPIVFPSNKTKGNKVMMKKLLKSFMNRVALEDNAPVMKVTMEKDRI